MSKDEIHAAAESTTPPDVNIPYTWGGLIVWALAKWGIGVVFLALLVPVYQDLKTSNSQLAAISTNNVRVLEALASKIEASNVTVQRLADDIRRLEASNASRPRKYDIE
jgi:hypothetical protein